MLRNSLDWIVLMSCPTDFEYSICLAATSFSLRLVCLYALDAHLCEQYLVTVVFAMKLALQKTQILGIVIELLNCIRM